MGMQIGLSGAAVLDPTNNSSENVLGTFGTLFATTLLLAVDAHLVMIDAVAKSVARHSDRRRPPRRRACVAMVRSARVLFGLGLQFAAPVIAAVLVANTALAVLSRAAPQLNILSVAFPVQIGIGLVALAASIPFVGAFYHGWSGVYNNTLDRVLQRVRARRSVMADRPEAERTEDATPRRREEAHEEGRIPRSQELTIAVSLLAQRRRVEHRRARSPAAGCSQIMGTSLASVGSDHARRRLGHTCSCA